MLRAESALSSILQSGLSGVIGTGVMDEFCPMIELDDFWNPFEQEWGIFLGKWHGSAVEHCFAHRMSHVHPLASPGRTENVSYLRTLEASHQSNVDGWMVWLGIFLYLTSCPMTKHNSPSLSVCPLGLFLGHTPLSTTPPLSKCLSLKLMCPWTLGGLDRVHCVWWRERSPSLLFESVLLSWDIPE